MKKQFILGIILIAAVVALVVASHNRIHFDFAVFRRQVTQVDWRKIFLAVACIYVGYLFRSMRWVRLVRHNKQVPLLSLLGTQIIGFTSVALVGRVADLSRPYLVARKTDLPLSSQIAVYIVERLFDAGSLALVFSCAILFAPQGSLPHAEVLKKFGTWGLLGTFAGALFLFAVRMAGDQVARFFENLLGRFSPKLGHAAGHKIRTFHAGLDTMRTVSDFAIVVALSLVLWVLIALAYFESARAFSASPLLSVISFPQAVLMLAVSGGASFFQLPVLGWFSQIGVVAAAMSALFGVPGEVSTAWSTLLLLVTFLSPVPVGLVWAQFENINLRKIAVESEQAGEQLPESATEDSTQWSK